MYKKGKSGGRTHSGVGCAEFLLSADDGAGALGGVDGGLALDDTLAVDGGATVGAHFATNASSAFPILVGHFVCGQEVVRLLGWGGGVSEFM